MRQDKRSYSALALQISRGNGVELTIQLPLKTPQTPKSPLFSFIILIHSPGPARALQGSDVKA